MFGPYLVLPDKNICEKTKNLNNISFANDLFIAFLYMLIWPTKSAVFLQLCTAIGISVIYILCKKAQHFNLKGLSRTYKRINRHLDL